MNLRNLDKSKSMFHEAAQKGKKLRGAELWEIEGGHQNLTRSSNHLKWFGGDPNAQKGF